MDRSWRDSCSQFDQGTAADGMSAYDGTGKRVVIRSAHGYPEKMLAFSSRLKSALRAITMALLLLSVVLNPMVAYVGDVHEPDHASAASQTDAADHHHVETAVSGSDNADDRAGDVWHGLMHVDHVHGASTAAVLIQVMAVVPQNPAVVFPPTAPLTSAQHIAGPFRPPIA